mgnify:CR=1 FL=1
MKAQIFPSKQLGLHSGRVNFKLMVPVKKISPILDISQINGQGFYFETLTQSRVISKEAVKAQIFPSKANKANL